MKYAYFIFFCITSLTFAQDLSDKAEISLITAGPGNTELYEAFGHTTVRVYDPKLNIDFAYNYGIFDFNAPNFYLNFAKGYMLYKLARYPFYAFINSYKQDKRWIKEQVLNLNQNETQRFFNYLQKNARPENASYLYDPYFNNCATVIRDITKNNIDGKLVFSIPKKNTTLRTIMHQEIPWNTWGSFGIDIALGSILDQKASFGQTMYLPDHLAAAFKNAKIKRGMNKVPLVKKERTILDFPELQQHISIFNPLLVFSILCLLVIILTIHDYKNDKRSKLFDFTLFFITGSIGLVIVFLWFFTNHSTAPKNYNFLWAFAPNIIIAFFLLKNKLRPWLSNYMVFLVMLLVTASVLWYLQVQVFSFALIPIFILLAFRFIFLRKCVWMD